MGKNSFFIIDILIALAIYSTILYMRKGFTDLGSISAIVLIFLTILNSYLRMRIYEPTFSLKKGKEIGFIFNLIGNLLIVSLINVLPHFLQWKIMFFSVYGAIYLIYSIKGITVFKIFAKQNSNELRFIKSKGSLYLSIIDFYRFLLPLTFIYIWIRSTEESQLSLMSGYSISMMLIMFGLFEFIFKIIFFKTNE